MDVTLPKGRIGTAEFTGRIASALPLLPDKSPVSEFVIFRPGVNESDYGPVVFDDVAAAFVMQFRAEKGNPLKFDYNHGQALKYATAEQGKSAGDFELEVRDGALMAVNCQWTAEAFQRISKGEYSLFSPWFNYIDTDDGVRRVFCLNNVAILNVAGLNDIDQIAAGASTTSTTEPVMNEAEIKALQDRNRALEAENVELRTAKHEVAVLSGSLQLASGAGSTERTQAVIGLLALRGEVRKVTGQDTDEKAVAALQAIHAKAQRCDAAETQLGEIQASTARKEFDAVLDGASKDGKLPPAERAKLESSILALTGGKITAAAIEAAKTNVGLLGARVATTPTAGSTAGQTGDMPAELLKNIGGLKPASVKAAWERQQARLAERRQQAQG